MNAMRGAPLRRPEIALIAQGLSRSFGGLRAIQEVSFDVRAGTITALIGPNGAGKTTLFNLITNIFPPHSGTVSFFGARVEGWSPNRIAAAGLIRTFQSARVFPGMTALENVLVGRHRLRKATILGQMLRTPFARREERAFIKRAEQILELVGLAAKRDALATELPMGSQKLLDVARALMARPRVLLLDEPAAGLNDRETAELSDLLLAIRASDITILIVEHNMSLVMDVADQVIVLEAGRLIARGVPSAVQADERVIAAYLGSAEQYPAEGGAGSRC
jgi:branched-chain amino acid transport system ATP-binding protein